MANAAPPLVANQSKLFLSLAKPIDNNRKFFGKPILGDHKTWRGLFAELIVGTGYFQILFLIHNFFSLNLYQVIGFDQYLLHPIIVGFLISVGAIVGDLFFAFIKRRLNLKPGKPFIPFDQINYCLGCFIFLQPIFNFNLLFWLVLLPLTFVIHIAFNRLGYNLGLHKAKW
ncbi:CDP-archaeol synthase [bacterium]|nr:CDP-archaeol synthase [bacterium]